ncbi:hypothetical protein A5906_13995 [Bradyrhizobium sacchari]|nr:hypothetical protein A5906_13995 [Bradyrhizobium sacchari]
MADCNYPIGLPHDPAKPAVHLNTGWLGAHMLDESVKLALAYLLLILHDVVRKLSGPLGSELVRA